MSTPAKLSDKIYLWTKPDGGHDIGRIVSRADDLSNRSLYLVRCEFGHLYWVDSRELIEHDVSYRQREREQEST